MTRTVRAIGSSILPAIPAAGTASAQPRPSPTVTIPSRLIVDRLYAETQ